MSVHSVNWGTGYPMTRNTPNTSTNKSAQLRAHGVKTEGSILTRILTCIRELKLWKRVLTYALQSDRLTGRQCRTVDSVWMQMLRSMVRGRFARNGPDSTRFTRSNVSILSACNTRSASNFCQQQHLRYLAHVCRMENDALKKQLLFAPPRKKEVSHWKRLANDYKIDESQLRRTLFDKKAVNKLLQATHGEC